MLLIYFYNECKPVGKQSHYNLLKEDTIAGFCFFGICVMQLMSPCECLLSPA
jgi:hypothetical protein